MKSIKILMAVVLLLSSFVSHAEIKNVSTKNVSTKDITKDIAKDKEITTENVKISGSCALCKQGIETAAFEKNVSKANWDKDTQMAVITFNVKKTSIDAVLKKIALAGYDNQSYLAPDDAYARLAGCCKYERAAKKQAVAEKKMPEHPHGAIPHGAMAGTDKDPAGDPIKPVLDAYYALKDALVSSDGNAASTHAAILVKAIKAVKMDQLASEQHTVWMKVIKDLDFDADHISETKDVSHQRDHFSSLSENMYKLIKSGKPSETVYYQHCPMANQGKGANWLSQIPTVKNPYYGAQMLTCGKTTETIK